MPRQKEFDPDQALTDAMELFWEQGYESTSVQDLVDRLGINRFSLYDTFGSKHELFIRALDRYREEMGSQVLNNLRTSGQGIGAIKAYFAAVIDHLSSAKGKAGCLMVNTLVEQAALDDEVGECVMRNVKALEEAFRLAVERAQDLGEIDSDGNSKQLAEYLATNAIGLNVLGKANRSRKRLERTVEIILKALE